MYNNIGSVIKFQKRDASLLYRVAFKTSSDTEITPNGLTEITAQTMTSGGVMIGCGKHSVNLRSAFFRMDPNGNVKALTAIEIASVKIECNGITYDESAGVATLLLSSTATGLKSSLIKETTVTDAFLYQINDAGNLVKAKHISFAKTGSLLSTNL
jgi:hypothetical protein